MSRDYNVDGNETWRAWSAIRMIRSARIQMGNIVGASAFVLKINGWTIKLLSAVPYTLSQHQFLLSHMYSHILYFSRMRNL